MDTFQFFDPKQDYTVASKQLPHWSQAGTLAFITWRTADSLPKQVQLEITRERRQLLEKLGLDPQRDCKAALQKLPAAERGRVRWSLFRLWDERLDAGSGGCVLGRPELSKIVEESLLHFDCERYVIADSVVMPNHVHLLAAFPDEDAMMSQCTSWKRYTGRQINGLLGQDGEFWQVEQFDHLVRSEEQFQHYRRYIAENPRKARLAARSFRWYSKASLGETRPRG